MSWSSLLTSLSLSLSLVFFVCFFACIFQRGSADHVCCTGLLAVCSNGVINEGEQCDDGNMNNGDGCSSSCQLEDTNAWLCTNAPNNGITSCCVALTNPLTEEKVCSCAGITGYDSAVTGYTITPTCQKLNLDECLAGTHNCHRNAICVDKDAVSTDPAQLFECVCPPGLVGDGINECQVYSFQTRFTLIKTNAEASSFDKEAFKQYLITSGTISSSISPSRILVEVVDYNGSGGNNNARRLLQVRQLQQSGSILITVTISSLTAEDQQTVTASTQVSNLQSDLTLSVQTAPASVKDAYDNAGEAILTKSNGFRVTGIQYNESDATWVVGVVYSYGSPNVVSSLYLPKAGTSQPYSTSVQNTYLIAQHPCMVSQSVCCMLDYQTKYQLGSFSANITNSVGACDENTSNANTQDLGFDPAGNEYAIDHALDEYPDSWIERVGPGEIKLHIAQTDLSNSGLAMKEPLPNNQQGYLLTFFIGMTHFTMLPANSLSTVASQSKIQLSISSSLTFSFSTSQDSTVLRYITLQIMQNKWMNTIIEKKMQFVKVDFVLPVGLRQNMNTGLVPLNSIRFAIGKTAPDQLNPAEWTNPCFSTDGSMSGMYDSELPYYDWYNQAQQQSCALKKNLCTNPTNSVLSSSIMANSMVSFYFPIGDNIINSTILGSTPSPYYLYVYFQLSVLASDGSVVLSNLYAKAPLDTLVINQACESISSEVNILSTTNIDIALGFVGHDEDWDTTMRLYPNVNDGGAATNKSVIDASGVKSHSVQSNLISLVVRGSPAIFSRASASQYYINVEQLSVMHFLDATKFNTVMAKVQDKSAYSVVVDQATGKPRMVFAKVFTLISSSCDL